MTTPRKRRLTTFGLLLTALMAGAAASWPWLGAPALEQLTLARSAESELRQTLAKQQEQVANFDRYEAELKQVQSQYANLLRQLPEQLMLDTLLADLGKHAEQNALSVTHLMPAAATKQAFYTAVPVEISLQGDWQGLHTFIHQIAQLSRMVTLEAIEASVIPEAAPNHPLAARLTLITYWQAHTEDRITQIRQPPNPAEPPAPAPIAPDNPFDPTRVFPITLEYLGRIFIGEQIWALIRTPKGRLQSLQIGDPAPHSEWLELIKINADSIELSLSGQTHRIERTTPTGRPLP